MPPGGVSSYQFAVCFYRGGAATAATEMPYYYTRFFRNIEAVGAFALNKWGALSGAARASDGLLDTGKAYLSPTQQFMMAHAIRRATRPYASLLLVPRRVQWSSCGLSAPDIAHVAAFAPVGHTTGARSCCRRRRRSHTGLSTRANIA